MEDVSVPIKVNAEVTANLSDATKLGGKLIATISRACGVLYEPIDTVRKAKADAKAKRISVESSIEIDRLLRRAGKRFLQEQIRQQANVDAIVGKALEQPEPTNVSQEPCDPDWVNEFFDCAKNVSNAEMQELLAKLLADEVAQPGTFSRRTLNLVRTLSRSELEHFKELLAFTWRLSGDLVIVPTEQLLSSFSYPGPSYASVMVCQSIGLIHGQATLKVRRGTEIRFEGHTHISAEAKGLEVHGHSLTSTGVELSNILTADPDAIAYAFWLMTWRVHLEPHENIPPKVPAIPGHLDELDESRFDELAKAMMSLLNYWINVGKSYPFDQPTNSALWFGDQLKIWSKSYSKVRAEAIRRDPDCAEQWPALDEDPPGAGGP